MTLPLANDTIFALSSGQPPAAIAILRVSGPAARDAVLALARSVPPPRTAHLAILRDPVRGDPLDRALVLYFEGPKSATGEDMVEFHLHGGRAVVAAVERSLSLLPGLRPAIAGEFTRRAFQNGRLDLAEAEGLADLLLAETEGQRRNAMLLADGALSRAVRRWRDALVAAAAALEARIDFADEDDVPDDDGATAQTIASIRLAMSTLLSAPPAERLRDGIRVVIGGPPNSGKSTLFNSLVGREAAIATPIAGTTRDLIEVPVQFAGLPFLFIDTAGLRVSDDLVESMGIDRAEAAIESADILLWLGEASLCPRQDALRLHACCDRPEREVVPPESDIVLSVVTGQGLDHLRDALVSRGTSLVPGEGEVGLAHRQREALGEACAALAMANDTTDILIQAEALRGARAALDRLTGEAGVEHLLDALFGKFCIGK